MGRERGVNEMDRKTAKLLSLMAEYNEGDPKQVQHSLKVHSFAAAIAAQEALDAETADTLEAAALMHDVGIRKAREVYGSSAGPYQEEQGPPIAERLMNACGGYTQRQIGRVMYLVGHHHTYDSIDGIDYQILVEADFLVNLFEQNESQDAVRSVRERIFRTEAGTRLLDTMFLTTYDRPPKKC